MIVGKQGPSSILGRHHEAAVQLSLLAVLVFYTSSLSFLVHISRHKEYQFGESRIKLYSVPVSILLSEIIKLFFCIGVECYIFSRGRLSGYQRIKDHRDRTLTQIEEEKAIDTPTGTLQNQDELEATVDYAKLYLSSSGPLTLHSTFYYMIDGLKPPSLLYALPAVLYVAQSMTHLVALSLITPVLFQTITQTKLLSAALLSRIFMKKTFSQGKIVFLFGLVVGIIVIATDLEQAPRHQTSSVFPGEFYVDVRTWRFAGVLLTVIGGMFGSGAGLVMELILKQEEGGTMWMRNAHLSIFSIIFTAILVASERFKLGDWYLLQGFNIYAWLVVVARAFVGLLIALVLRYTNIVVKGK